MIYFLFSFKQVGGVPILFYNIAKGLSQRKIDFSLISYKDSAIFKLFNSSFGRLNFIDYENVNRINVVNWIHRNDVIVITWWEPKLEIFSVVNPKIFFWNVFPDTLKYSNNVFRGVLLKNKTKKLIEKMMELKGLVFMDDAPFVWFDEFKINKNHKLLLSIPVDIGENLYLNRNLDNATFRLTYIGRSEIWKIFPLKKIIDDLTSIREPKKRIVLNVVSDNVSHVRSMLGSIENKNEKFCVNYFENIPNFQIGEFLLNNSDLNIGMGTTLLEASKIGIPSLVIDPSYSPILENYRYRWLYEITNYNLGSFYDKDKNYTGYSLSEIINSFNDKEFILNKSNECYEYVKENHNGAKIIDRFILFTNRTKLRINVILSKVFLYTKIYKIKKRLRLLTNYMRNSIILLMNYT